MTMDLRTFLDDLQERLPYDFIRIERPISPKQFEVTALLQHLENQKKFPVLFFEKPLDLNGKPSVFPLLSNVFATRQRCALSLGMKPNDGGLPLSLEYARREDRMLAPITVPRSEAPVKQVIKRGDDANIYDLPVVRHHAMDPAPYIDMTPVMKDPDEGFYNIAFQRNMVKGPRKLGLHMSPRHNWQIHRKNEEKNRPTPVVIVISHHPAFYLGSLNVSPFGVDDYAKVGAIMGTPLRLTPSETLGEDFMVPADAEMVIEGHVLPNVKEVEGPFGEFTGYLPQEVELFPGTIKDNICRMRADLPDDKIYEAAVLTDVHSMVSQLPSGYETILERSGAPLSRRDRSDPARDRTRATRRRTRPRARRRRAIARGRALVRSRQCRWLCPRRGRHLRRLGRTAQSGQPR